MNCECFEIDLSLLAADALPAEDQPALRQHLAECPVCREKLAQLSAVCELVQESRPAIPAVDAQRMADRVREELQVARPTKLAPRRLLLAIVALAACLVAALILRGLFVGDPDRQQANPQQPPMKNSSPNEVASRPPTLLDYQTALADSDEAVDLLLDREAHRLTFISVNQSPLTAKDFEP